MSKKQLAFFTQCVGNEDSQILGPVSERFRSRLRLFVDMEGSL